MNNPLRTKTVVVPAGATGVIETLAGKHVKIVSITVASVLMGFDQQSPERVYQGDCYAGPTKGFKSLRFVAAVGACTVVVQVSEQPISGTDGQGLAGIGASLVSIDQELSGSVDCTQLAAVNVPITGGLGLQIVAANPTRIEVSLSGPDSNGGIVYLGKTNAVSALNFMDLVYPGGNWYEERYKGPVFAVGSDALQRIGGYEI